MGGAAAARLCGQGPVCVYDPSPAALAKIPADIGRESLPQLCQNSEYIVLAVKPGIAGTACEQIKGFIKQGQPVISFIAGLSTAALQKMLPGANVLRTMPNTPAMIGQGVLACSTQTELDQESITQKLAPLGKVFWLPENDMDAVTALCGSGPAYVFMFIEALAEAGVHAGLPHALTLEMAAQTVLGSAALCQATGEHPAALKNQVCSPGGTTIAGVAALEQNGLRHAIFEAIKAAKKRSEELA